MAMGWRVTGQRQQDNLTPQGVFEPVWIVSFTVEPEGVVGSVTIPVRFYTPEYVQDEIDKQATAIKAVHAL